MDWTFIYDALSLIRAGKLHGYCVVCGCFIRKTRSCRLLVCESCSRCEPVALV